MSECSLYYIHGIIPADRAGWDGDGLLPGTVVDRLTGTDFAAVVTDLRESGYDIETLQEVLKDAAQCAEFVVSHQSVLARLHAVTRSVLPLRFCTLYQDTDSLIRFLNDPDGILKGSMSQISHTSEWGVKLIKETVAQRPSAVSGSPPETNDAASGTQFLRARLQQRKQSDEKRKRKTDRQEEVHSALVESSKSYVAHALRVVDSHKDRPGRMVWNASYLVQDDKRASFHDVARDWSRRLGSDHWRLDLTGPWPPYSFATIGSGAQETTGDRLGCS